MKTVKRAACKCLRCGFEWVSRKEGLPVRCANLKCRSPYWRMPRKPKGEDRFPDFHSNTK